MIDTKYKQPADELDYDLDFSHWIPDDDTVTSAVAVTSTVDGDTSPLVVESVSIASPVVKVWLTGGTDGNTYKITAKASTSGGRVKEVEFNVRVKER